MKKFKKMNDEIIELYGEIERVGILENENDGLFEVCEPDNDDAFTTVDAIYEDGTYYVDYNERSRWSGNVVCGEMLED